MEAGSQIQAGGLTVLFKYKPGASIRGNTVLPS